jgi:hypothetical protein
LQYEGLHSEELHYEELVGLHVQHCRACAQLAGMLPALVQDLSSLAAVQPDARFVADVVRRTSGAPRPNWAARWQQGWEALLRRPRFAWEVAYGATIAIALLVGPRAAPLHDVPKQALSWVQFDPAALTGASQRLAGRAMELGNQGLQVAWDATGGGLESAARREIAAFESRHPGLPANWTRLGQHLRQIGSVARTGDLSRLLAT